MFSLVLCSKKGNSINNTSILIATNYLLAMTLIATSHIMPPTHIDNKHLQGLTVLTAIKHPLPMAHIDKMHIIHSCRMSLVMLLITLMLVAILPNLLLALTTSVNPEKACFRYMTTINTTKLSAFSSVCLDTVLLDTN